jgi:hypothetical protein
VGLVGDAPMRSHARWAATPHGRDAVTGGDNAPLVEFQRSLATPMIKGGLGERVNLKFNALMTLLYDDRTIPEKAVAPVEWPRVCSCPQRARRRAPYRRGALGARRLTARRILSASCSRLFHFIEARFEAIW